MATEQELSYLDAIEKWNNAVKEHNDMQAEFAAKSEDLRKRYDIDASRRRLACIHRMVETAAGPNDPTPFWWPNFGDKEKYF